jgi:hypothetical protein
LPAAQQALVQDVTEPHRELVSHRVPHRDNGAAELADQRPRQSGNLRRTPAARGGFRRLKRVRLVGQADQAQRLGRRVRRGLARRRHCQLHPPPRRPQQVHQVGRAHRIGRAVHLFKEEQAAGAVARQVQHVPAVAGARDLG